MGDEGEQCRGTVDMFQFFFYVYLVLTMILLFLVPQMLRENLVACFQHDKKDKPTEHLLWHQTCWSRFQRDRRNER